MNIDSYKLAKDKLISGDYSVENYFKQNNFILEYGYCKLLQGEISEAENILQELKDIDFRAGWAVKLIGIIYNEIKTLPSYFQIRNFLEIDLNLLLKAEQVVFVENIINSSDVLASVNPESYKFIARIMQNNDFLDVAMYYLIKAKSKFYYDPEMHLMLANCYLSQGNSKLAEESAQNCLRILPEYVPAKKFLLMLK